MKIFHLVLIFLHGTDGKLPDYEKIEFCGNLECDDSVEENVCGVKYEEDEVTFKLFDNECLLLKYGCQVDDSQTYGIINMKYCGDPPTTTEKIEHVKFITNASESDCLDCTDDVSEPVCGIRKDGEGFRIRTFNNECMLLKYNCENDLQFNLTDFFICQNDLVNTEDDRKEINDEEMPTAVTEQEEVKKIVKMKSLVVVDGSLFDKRNINESIDNFFAATHVLDLPVQEMQPSMNESTRRMVVKIFGPAVVYRPWVRIPKNISDDYYHKPTLSTCYHKCPTKCPDTYAPVCGVPGLVAREPSLMFQNHCFMDVAQCKMHWEGKSYTASSSAYIESSFLFCLGDELNGLYRFLPLIKTLQHMGRLKTKGHFRYKFKNLRFLNNLLSRDPKIMG